MACTIEIPGAHYEIPQVFHGNRMLKPHCCADGISWPHLPQVILSRFGARVPHGGHHARQSVKGKTVAGALSRLCASSALSSVGYYEGQGPLTGGVTT